ncbi:RRP46 [Malassezia furfur]|nr:RRP46 [Malassezia furfur]
MRDELTDSATFQVVVSPLENVAGIPTKALATEFQALFESVLLLHRHPRTLIQLVIQTTSKPPTATPTVNLSLNRGGSATASEEEQQKRHAPLLLGPDVPFTFAEIAASINASTLALIDAGIPLRATIVATSCAVVSIDDALRTRDVDPTKGSYCVLVDPSPEEEKVAESCHVYAFAFSGYNPLSPKDAESELAAQLVYYASTGRTNGKKRAELFVVAEESAERQLGYLRDALRTQDV